MAVTTLHHPTLDASVQVDSSRVDEWVEAGWRKTRPKAVSEAQGEQAAAEFDAAKAAAAPAPESE